jgi:hypothetical protein
MPKASTEWNEGGDIACVNRGVADAQDLSHAYGISYY